MRCLPQALPLSKGDLKSFSSKIGSPAGYTTIAKFLKDINFAVEVSTHPNLLRRPNLPAETCSFFRGFLTGVSRVSQSCIEYNNDVEGEQGQAEFIELAKQLRTQAQEMGAKVRAPAPCLRSLAVPPYVCRLC